MSSQVFYDKQAIAVLCFKQEKQEPKIFNFEYVPTDKIWTMEAVCFTLKPEAKIYHIHSKNFVLDVSNKEQ